MRLPTGKIICGDCKGILPNFPSCSFDLTVTSPPYDNLRDYEGCSFDFKVFKIIAKELFRVTKKGGVVVWIVGDQTLQGNETGTSFRQTLYFKKVGFNLHDTMIYTKRGFASPSATRYHQVFEYMFVFSKGEFRTFNPIRDRKNIEKHRGGDSRRQKNGSMKKGNKKGKLLDKFGQRWNVWEYKIGGGHISSNRIVHQHPAAFPEQLAIDHIRSWSNPNDVILDPFAGSGTTCVAAERLERKWIGIDISKKYCEIARKRIAYEKRNPGFRIFK